MEREGKTSLQWSNLLVLDQNVSCSCNGIARPLDKNDKSRLDETK